MHSVQKPTHKLVSNLNLVDFHVEKESQREPMMLVNAIIVMLVPLPRQGYDLRKQAMMRLHGMRSCNLYPAHF